MSGKKKDRLTFGLLVDWIDGWEDTPYYQTKILSGVEDFTRENDINLMCFVTGRIESPIGWERSRNVLFDMVTKDNIDGLLVLAASIGQHASKEHTLKLLSKYNGIPMVTLNEGFEGIPYVSIDNKTGMQQLVDHLIEVHQCRKIAFIKGPSNNNESVCRFEAYMESLRKHNIPYNEDLVCEGDFIFISGSKAVETLLDDRNLEFDAIVAANDNMAVGAIAELHKRAGRIPENLPVVGFDDAEISKYYSLTTVNQSFNNHAKMASRMLLDLIQGRKSATEIEVPTQIVIRSSCGCISSKILSSSIGHYQFSNTPFVVALETNKNRILEEFAKVNQAVQPQYIKELLHFQDKLLDALYKEIHLKKSQRFLQSWNSLIFWSIMKNLNLHILQDMLSILRKFTLTCISNQTEIAKVEDLFHAARIQIGEAIQRTETSYKILSYFSTDKLDNLGEELISTLDCKNQMDLIHESLPAFGICQCFVCLFNDPENPLLESRLILAYNNSSRSSLDPDGILFSTSNILPEPILEELNNHRFSVIVQALYQGDHRLGFALFDSASSVGKVYEIVRYRLSIALKGSLLIEKIKNQALDLEKQVIERTKDLSITNTQLKKEIIHRNKVEEQLKKALKELEIYNKKLHHQSLRDELTGLYNRRGFMTLATKHYDYAKKNNKGFLVFFADLDGLKQINDRFGHKEGDYAIYKTAKILNESFRDIDLIARLGGDEFTILVANALPKDEHDLEIRLMESFEYHNKKTNKPYTLSVSLGSAYFTPESPYSFEELLTHADQVLYHQKELKKSTVRHFSVDPTQ